MIYQRYDYCWLAECNLVLCLQYNDGEQWAGLLDDPKEMAGIPSGDFQADLQVVLRIIQSRLPVDIPEE